MIRRAHQIQHRRYAVCKKQSQNRNVSLLVEHLEVNVHIREPRHQILRAPIDLQRPGRNLDRRCRTKRGYQTVLYDHRLIGEHHFLIHRDNIHTDECGDLLLLSVELFVLLRGLGRRLLLRLTREIQKRDGERADSKDQRKQANAHQQVSFETEQSSVTRLFARNVHCSLIRTVTPPADRLSSLASPARNKQSTTRNRESKRRPRTSEDRSR